MAVKSFLGADPIDEWRPRGLACRWGDVSGDNEGNNADSGAFSYSGGDFSGGFDNADSWSSVGDSFGGSFDGGGWGDTSGVSFGDAGVGSGGFGTGDFGGGFDSGGFDSIGSGVGGGFNDGGGAWSSTGDFGDFSGGGVSFGDAGIGSGGFGTGDFGDGFNSFGGSFDTGGSFDAGFPGVGFQDAPFSGGWDAYNGAPAFEAGSFGGPSWGISGPGDTFGGLYGGLYGQPGETLSGMDIAGDYGPNAANMGNSLGGVTGGMPNNVNPNTSHDAGNQGLRSADWALAPVLMGAGLGIPGLYAGGLVGSLMGAGGLSGFQPARQGDVTINQSELQTVPVIDPADLPVNQEQAQSNFGPAESGQSSNFGAPPGGAPSGAPSGGGAPSGAPTGGSAFGGAPPSAPPSAPPNAPPSAPPQSTAQGPPSNPFAPSPPNMALPEVDASKVGSLVNPDASKAAKSLLDMTPQQMNAALLEAAKPGSVQPPTVWDRVTDFFSPSQAEAGNPLSDIVKALRTGPFAAMPGNQEAQQAQQVARDQQWFTQATPTDKYLADVYNRTPQKVDSTGDFTWKDAAAANYYGKGTTEYAIGGLHPDFKTVLEAMGKAMDRAGIPWSISAAYRDNARQAITQGFRASTTGSMHGGTGRLGGDRNNPMSTYGKGQAIDVTGVERGPQKNDNQKVWDFIDKYGQQFGVSRPMKGSDPPHLQPTAKFQQIAAAIRGGFDPMSRTAFAPTAPAPPAQAGRGPGASQDNRSAFGPPHFTAYAPGTGGRMEGGINAAQKGPDGTYRAHTAEDVRAARERGEDDYVTLAKHDRSPYKYGQEINIPILRYQDRNGNWQTLENVKGVVHDRGTAKALREGALDVATFSGKGLTDKEARSRLAQGIKTDAQVAAAPPPPQAPPPQAAQAVPHLPGITAPAFASTPPAVPSQPAGGRLVPSVAPPGREVPSAPPNAQFVPQAPPGRELQQEQPRSVAFLPPGGEISQAPSGAQNVPQSQVRGAELSPALSYELLPNLDPGGLHGATPGTSPLASGWLASQQSRGPAFPGWNNVGNPLSGGRYGGLPAEYGENYGVAGPPIAPPSGVTGSPAGLPGSREFQPTPTGSPAGLPGTLPAPLQDQSGGSPAGLPGSESDYSAYGPGEPATGSPGGLPGGEGDYSGYGQEGMPVSAMPTAPAAPAQFSGPANPAFKSEPMLAPSRQFDVNSKTISTKFNLSEADKKAGKDFLKGLSERDAAAIIEGKTPIIAVIERRATEAALRGDFGTMAQMAAKTGMVDIAGKAREYVQQNYPGGIAGLQRDATHMDMTQPTPSGIQSELARPGGAEAYDDQGTPVAAMPTAPAAPPSGMPSWIATPSANTTQPGSLAGMFGAGFVPGGQLPGFTPGGGNFGGRGATGTWDVAAKGDLQPNDFNSRFGDWGGQQAFQPAVQQAQQEAQSNPQQAQQIAQANPQAVQQIAQQYGVDILTAAMMLLSLEERPRFVPQGSNGSDFGRWPRLPAPDFPGQFQGLGREIVRQNYEAQNPINSLASMMESGAMQFNPQSWDAVLAHAPYSQNVEDRRNQTMIGMR